ncbi:hypothetical protein NDU88_006399 [Pleurodeles waltl]|uniref:Uncharacterized protein n=1 Tax=Pleurodeles waltl TaxID=8319 RepID=A0AAV7N288_PLEWA|nr:hypothetical protein NDU88_006399 [Pleurodeles waltl]
MEGLPTGCWGYEGAARQLMHRAARGHIEDGSMEEEVAWGPIGASVAGCGWGTVLAWLPLGAGLRRATAKRCALAWAPQAGAEFCPESVPPLSEALHHGGKEETDRCWRVGHNAAW